MPTFQSAWHGAAAPGGSGSDPRGVSASSTSLRDGSSSAPGAPGPSAGAGRTLLLAAVGPLVTGYLGISAVLALVTATAPGATVSTRGVLRAAGPAWLAVYHVPVFLSGRELGMLPLGPTLLALTLVARSAGNAARRLDWDSPRRAARMITTVGVAHAVFASVVAMLSAGAAVSASPVVAFFVAGAFASVAATLGTARPCRLVAAVLGRADDATVAGLRAGLLAVVGLFTVGAVVFGIALADSFPVAVRLFQATAPGAGSGFGMFLLSVSYLPNAFIGTLSFAVGPGFTIGSAAVMPWRFHTGPLPAVPVLAPLPAVEAHWWIFLTLLPAGVGVLAGLVCRRVDGGLGPRVRAAGVAALVAGVGWLVLAALAGGALAGGPFDPVTVPAGLLGVSVFLFVAVPGALTAAVPDRETWVDDRAEPAWDSEPDAAAEPEPVEEPEQESEPEQEPEPELESEPEFSPDE
jgi:hypothetical protein